MATPKLFIKVPEGSGKGKASPPAWDVPRLARALFNAKAGAEPFRSELEKANNLASTDASYKPKVTLRVADRAKFLAELKSLCAHLRWRLEGGLPEAWMGDGGYPVEEFKALLLKAYKEKKTPSAAVDRTNADLAAAADFYDSGEEQWARAFCEMVVFSMYHSVGMVYGTGNTDKPWYDRYPKIYSVAMACQTMSTYCVLSRGLTAIGVNGLGCTGGIEKLGVFQKGLKKEPLDDEAAKKKAEAQARAEGKITDASTDEDKEREIAAKLPNIQNYPPTWGSSPALVQEGAIPGSAMIFNGGGYKCPHQNHTPGTTHIASVLRVAGQQLQFIDTGVVTGAGESGTEAGAVDHNFTTGTIPSSESAVAFGVAMSVDDAQLVDQAKLVAQAKPLGVMRLVVADAAKKEPWFVSKLVHMRWPLSKLIWSLRNAPTDGLMLAWLVWAPRITPASEDLASTIAAGTSKAPSADIKLSDTQKALPKDKRPALLALTHVIYRQTDTPTKDVHVFRSYKLTEWYTESGGSRVKNVDVISNIKIDNKKLVDWCQNPDNFDRCYLKSQAPGDAGGASSEAINDPLVDLPAAASK